MRLHDLFRGRGRTSTIDLQNENYMIKKFKDYPGWDLDDFKVSNDKLMI